MAPYSDQPEAAPFLSLHAAVVLLAAVVIGLIVGCLTFLTAGVMPAAVLAGLCGSASSVPALHSLIGRP